LRIGLISALVILLYFLLIGWAVCLCERQLDKLFGTYLTELPPYQPPLPSPGRTATD
jgi:TM2 domain-containing membrane protein YozV